MGAETGERSDFAGHATRLRGAYDGRTLPPLRHALPGATVADAYAIQALNTRHWLDAGRRRVGAKIGLTAKTVQAQLGVDQPDFGVLFADMQIANGGAAPAGRLIQPKAEAEIAFTLARRPDFSSHAVLAQSVAYAQAAIEIVDSRIENWDIGIVDTVADNASSGLFVLGDTRAPLAAVDLRLAGMVLERNGEIVSVGTAAACLGNPLNAFAWLARTLEEFGAPLGEGDVVLAGALGPMAPAVAGDRFEASIAGLGQVRVRFEGGDA